MPAGFAKSSRPAATGASARVGRQRGFSLLEILVAFVILALSLGVLMQIYSDAMRNADLARDQTRATEIAQSLLASGDKLATEPTETEGTTADGFRWRVAVSPFADTAEAGGAVRASSGLDLWSIVVQVRWGSDGATGRSVRLATLRTRPRLAS